MLASHQVRIHAARGCDFYLRVRSNPIIEDCTRLGFAPCPADLPLAPEHLAAARLAEDTGLWAEVQDFLWLRSTPSPNWSVPIRTLTPSAQHLLNSPAAVWAPVSHVRLPEDTLNTYNR